MVIFIAAREAIPILIMDRLHSTEANTSRVHRFGEWLQKPKYRKSTGAINGSDVVLMLVDAPERTSAADELRSLERIAEVNRAIDAESFKLSDVVYVCVAHERNLPSRPPFRVICGDDLVEGFRRALVVTDPARFDRREVANAVGQTIGAYVTSRDDTEARVIRHARERTRSRLGSIAVGRISND